MPVWNPWRPATWAMIRARQDVLFTIITKRIVRFLDCVPPDWGDGWPNITVGCTVESQRQADIRLPFVSSAASVRQNPQYLRRSSADSRVPTAVHLRQDWS